MKRLRFYLILLGCLITGIGLFGPAVFVESKGSLSLHQVTFAARSANIPNPEIYLWLSLFFVVLILSVVVFSQFKMYKITGAISFLGLLVWSLGVLLYHQWRTLEIERLRAMGDINSLEHMGYTLFLRGLNLQWGIYLVLLGIVLILLFAVTAVNRYPK